MRLRLLAPTLGLCVTAAAGGKPPPRVQVTAVPELTSVTPGASFRVAVRLRIPDGYHISWTNPGQSGLPTTIAWRTPAGIAVEGTQWPYPERDVSAGLVGHVYRGEVVLVTRFRVDPSIRRGRTTDLRAVLTWGVCGDDCFSQRDTVALTLRVGGAPPEVARVWRGVVRSLDKLPAQDTTLRMKATLRGDSVHLTVTGAALRGTPPSAATFFPRPHGAAAVTAVQPVPGGLAFMLPADILSAPVGPLKGVLVADRPWLADSRRRALTVQATVPLPMP
jgi:DsbC/DsbD-like thiol-disulfide interchange protein